MVPVAGVDGCRGGWVVVTDGDAFVCPDFAAVLAELPDDAVIGVDTPIGLDDEYFTGGRDCDRRARAMLGRPRGSSVFPAPVRPALGARSIKEASNRGWPTNRQGLGILQKIEDVDRSITPALQARIREVHPEVSYYALNGDRPVVSPTGRAAGRAERRQLLRSADLDVPPRPRQGESEKDLLDACAALWSARRIAEHHEQRVPREPPTDSCGLRMEIVW
jgi:predicted RNase H-like nuclease